MKQRVCILAAVLLGCLQIAASLPPAADVIVALLSKVVLDVRHKQADSEWEVARRGETLASGDRVRTGEKSLAVVKFKDNSLVRVRERSELTISGTTEGSAFSKSVNVEKGVVGFNIRKQKPEEEFRFTSPTSVASIRGTGGQFTSKDGFDTLTVVEGAVLLTNTVSSTSVEVLAGFTGISNPDGTIETRPATSEELTAAQSASSISDQENRLEIDLQDGRGNRKQLKLDIRE